MARATASPGSPRRGRGVGPPCVASFGREHRDLARREPVNTTSRVHRHRGDGRSRDLLAAGGGGRGGGCRGLDLLPHRRRDRWAPGLLLRQDGGQVSVRRGPGRVRRARLWQRTHRGSHRLVAAGGQRHHHRDGGGVLRELRELRHAWRLGMGQGVRGPVGARDDGPQCRRIQGGGPGADGGGCRGHRDPHDLRCRHAVQRRPAPAGLLGLPAVQGHRLQRGPHVLRLPGLRRDHLHREGPRRPGPPAAPCGLPGLGRRNRDLRRCRPGCLRRADGR